MPDDREESTERDDPAEPRDDHDATTDGVDGDATVAGDESDDASRSVDSETDSSADDERESADDESDPTDGDAATEQPDSADEGDRTPGEGGLTFQGSPERDETPREKPPKPPASGPSDGPEPDATADASTGDEPGESADSSAGARTNGGTATASGSTAPVPSASVGTGTGTGTDSDEIGGISTPPDDEEMPLADHVEEMISRLAIAVLFGAAGTAIGLLWATPAIRLIWEQAIPQAEAWRPHLYGPLELWLTRIKVASLLGIMIALPVFVYETYLFMRPGLYSHERKYYLAAVPTSVILAGIGMLFSYLLVLPILFEYFSYYSRESATIKYALGTTFDLIITLTAFLAIVFQIPLFIMLAVMMGVTTRRWLADKRLYFWVAFAGLAFTFTIDPSGMAAGLVAITMIVLYEGTLLILKWTGVE